MLSTIFNKIIDMLGLRTLSNQDILDSKLIHAVVYYGTISDIDECITKGANPNVKLTKYNIPTSGNKPYYYKAWFDFVANSERLTADIPYIYGRSLVHLTVEMHDPKKLKHLIEFHNVSANCENTSIPSPLDLAVNMLPYSLKHGKQDDKTQAIEIVQILLKNAAKFNSLSLEGCKAKLASVKEECPPMFLDLFDNAVSHCKETDDVKLLKLQGANEETVVS